MVVFLFYPADCERVPYTKTIGNCKVATFYCAGYCRSVEFSADSGYCECCKIKELEEIVESCDGKIITTEVYRCPKTHLTLDLKSLTLSLTF